MRETKPLITLFVVALSLSVWGCSSKTYSGQQIQAEVREICEKEYGITGVYAKVSGDTLGVYLPVKKLFAADLKESLANRRVRQLETLFEPDPAALEKIEDVLFTLSRVMLSADRDYKFYELQATDVGFTGMQLILKGNVNDIKRVRVWDISREEYRKRVVHELRLNRAVLWHKPIHDFFGDLESLEVTEVLEKHFNQGLTPEVLQTLFFNHLNEDLAEKQTVTWEVLKTRSTPAKQKEVLIYTEVQPTAHNQDGTIETLESLEYLFMVTLAYEIPKIIRVIPFQYEDEFGNIHRAPFPKELQIQENIQSWQEEFSVEDMQLGPFLAQQVTRRIQSLVSVDERIDNTFRELSLDISFEEDAEPVAFFNFNVEGALRDLNNYSRESIVFHEDMLYLLDLASREFVNVLRSYSFKDYEHLKLNVSQEVTPRVLGREDLELFRRKKIDLQGLLLT